MKTQIEKLKEIYLSYEAVAAELEITSRHLRNVRAGIHPGKHLVKIINQLVAKVQKP